MLLLLLLNLSSTTCCCSISSRFSLTSTAAAAATFFISSGSRAKFNLNCSIKLYRRRCRQTTKKRWEASWLLIILRCSMIIIIIKLTWAHFFSILVAARIRLREESIAAAAAARLSEANSFFIALSLFVSKRAVRAYFFFALFIEQKLRSATAAAAAGWVSARQAIKAGGTKSACVWRRAQQVACIVPLYFVYLVLCVCVRVILIHLCELHWENKNEK